MLRAGTEIGTVLLPYNFMYIRTKDPGYTRTSSVLFIKNFLTNSSDIEGTGDPSIFLIEVSTSFRHFECPLQYENV